MPTFGSRSIHVGLVVLLVVCTTTSTHGMATATGDFKKWAAARYGPGIASPIGVTIPAHMLAGGNGLPFQEHFLNAEWRPWADGQDGQPAVVWAKRLQKLHTLGGVFLSWEHQGPLPDLEAFKQHTANFVRQALTHIAQVVQPVLTGALGGVIDWTLFQTGFNWLMPYNQVKTNICMPYNKAMLSRKRPKAEQEVHHGISMTKGGYLQVYCGMDSQGKPVYEYAHRLVCFAFRGAPVDMKHKVVSHLCNNPTCLNPLHMVWDTVPGNATFQGPTA